MSLGTITETDMKKICNMVQQLIKIFRQQNTNPKGGENSQFCMGGRVIQVDSKKGRQSLTMILKDELQNHLPGQQGKHKRRVTLPKGHTQKYQSLQ